MLPWFTTLTNALAAANAFAISIAAGWLALSKVPFPAVADPAGAALPARLRRRFGIRLLLSERESRYIRTAFSHYLAPAMVKQLVDNPQSLVLGENRELACCFATLRGSAIPKA